MPLEGPCPLKICDGSGMLYDDETNTSSHCECRAGRIASRLAKHLQTQIPKRYLSASWEREPILSMDKKLVRRVRSYSATIRERLEDGTGLFLIGPSGTGKTTLISRVARDAINSGITVVWYSTPHLLNTIRNTFNPSQPHHLNYLEMLDTLNNVEVLVLDDIGAERTTDWALEQFYNILNARYEEEKVVLMTSNLGLNELQDQIGSRCASRIAGLCNGDPILVEGRDHRYRADDTTSGGQLRIAP
jgi:DNA replication protein DnaC